MLGKRFEYDAGSWISFWKSRKPQNLRSLDAVDAKRFSAIG
jgi:hypothetical protein